MRMIILSICLITFAVGIYLTLIIGSMENRIKSSIFGTTRGILETAMRYSKKNLVCDRKKYNYIEKKIRKFKDEKFNQEIFSSCITLKNLAIVQSLAPMSSDFILEQLMDNSKKLKPIYAEIISAYRNGKNEDAFSIFYKKIKTKTSKNFGSILVKIDQINPAELIEQMTVFEDTMAEERLTLGIRKAERNSIIITMFATATIFALLLNFAIVVVFMDTMKMLGQVF